MHMYSMIQSTSLHFFYSSTTLLPDYPSLLLYYHTTLLFPPPTLLSFYSFFAAHYPCLLSYHPTLLPWYLTLLPYYPTLLSFYPSLLHVHVPVSTWSSLWQHAVHREHANYTLQLIHLITNTAAKILYKLDHFCMRTLELWLCAYSSLGLHVQLRSCMWTGRTLHVGNLNVPCVVLNVFGWVLGLGYGLDTCS